MVKLKPTEKIVTRYEGIFVEHYTKVAFDELKGKKTATELLEHLIKLGQVEAELQARKEK